MLDQLFEFSIQWISFSTTLFIFLGIAIVITRTLYQCFIKKRVCLSDIVIDFELGLKIIFLPFILEWILCKKAAHCILYLSMQLFEVPISDQSQLKP